MSTVRLTAAQAMVGYLASQLVDGAAGAVPYFAGVWAIFGHGNVAGMGEALYTARDVLPTLRAHNEQGMAHAAIAFAKQMRRRRAMVCTTSIGPGATNLVTAAALAHVNRLPVLLVPGDVFANRRPDPVLQQVEDFADGTVSVNDCLRPVSRYFDRISRPEQLLEALPRAMATLTDPVSCGPVTLAFCQDVQAEAWDFPESFLAPRRWSIRAPQPDRGELDQLATLLKGAKAPLIIVGGGVPYAHAEGLLADFALRAGVPVAETQAGKGSLSWDHPLNLGGIGVTGSSAANVTAAEADVIIGLGTRLQDFTTGSRALFARPGATLVQVNVSAYDAHKHGAVSVVGDIAATLRALEGLLGGWRGPSEWTAVVAARALAWGSQCEALTAATGSARAGGAASGVGPSGGELSGVASSARSGSALAGGARPGRAASDSVNDVLPGGVQPRDGVGGARPGDMRTGDVRPSDAQVLGAVWRKADSAAVVVCAAGGLPGELHKLWRVRAPGGYHVEYGYSCMGYEIAGGLGVKIAAPDREVYVLVGDGSYLMLSSELATSVMLGRKLIVTVLDNRGFGCINRLQRHTGGEPFNNLLQETGHDVDFAAHAASLGARAEKVAGIAELEAALEQARISERTYVIVIETDPHAATEAGGAWWDVAVAEVSANETVKRARLEYEQHIRKLRQGE